MPSAARAASAAMSASAAIPPDAMTGSPTCRANPAVPAASAPVSAPSRAMSV